MTVYYLSSCGLIGKTFMTTNSGVAARVCAAELLAQVLDRRQSLNESAAHHPPFGALDERDRHFARLLVMTTLRRLGQIDALLTTMLEKPLPAKARIAQHCLRLGVTQIVWLATPPHAAVNATVEATAALGLAPMKGLVNAVLKRVAREGAALVAGHDEARTNVPAWLFASWEATYGADTARRISLSRLGEPALDITVKEDALGWAERLGGKVLPTGSVRLENAPRIETLAGYEEGAWWAGCGGGASCFAAG